MRVPGIVPVFVLVAGVAAAQTATRIQAFDLGLTDPQLAVEVVRPLLSPAGRVYADPAQHRLIVSDRPDVLARVAAALRAVAVEPRNVRIRVVTTLERTERERGLEVTLPRRGGVGVRGGVSDARGSARSEQQLLVLSGSRATLRVAEETPYTQWFLTWGAGQGLWAPGTEWRDVETSLVVEPRLLGDGTLHVRVTPRFDYVVDARRLFTEVTTLSTEVVVPPGQDVDLGGLPSADREFRERFLVGYDESGQTKRVRMTLRADLE